jgi:hypothetical protein
MTGHELQQQLDLDGYAEVPPGTTLLDSPLFLDSGRALVGPARQACRLDTYLSGTAAVVGWRRGLVGDDHLPAGGFRTLGTAHLFARGTEFDLGRIQPGGIPSWGVLPTLTVKFTGLRHGSDWRTGTAELFETALAGCSAPGQPYGPAPSPWLLWWSNAGFLTLSLRLAAAGVAHVHLAASPTDPNLTVAVTADFAAGTLAGTVNGVAVSGTFPAGDRLAENADAPFVAGRADPFCNASGYWGGLRADMTIALVGLESGAWSVRTDAAGGRVPTYPGGGPLPLLKAYSTAGTRSVFMVHKDQGVADSAGNVAVRGVTFAGQVGNPVATVGAAQGQVQFADVAAEGGTRFAQCAGLAVVYPLELSGVRARYQGDRQLWLFKASTLAVRWCDFGYGGRAAASLLGCNGVLADVFVAPPGAPQGAVVEQAGGRVAYDRLVADYEYTPGAAATVRVTPASFEGGETPTSARLTDCDGGTAPLTAVLPRLGASGQCLVTVDGAVAHLSGD